MTVLLVQIFLLMLAAFLAGASLACFIRRTIAGLRTGDPVMAGATATGGTLAGSMPDVSIPAAGASVVPPVADASARSTGVNRFERALVGGDAVVPPPFQSNRGPVVEVQSAPVRIPEATAPPAAPAAQPAPQAAAPAAPPVVAKEPARPQAVEVKSEAPPSSPPPPAEPVRPVAPLADPAPRAEPPKASTTPAAPDFTSVAAAAAAAAAQAAAQKVSAQAGSVFGAPPIATAEPAQSLIDTKGDDLLRIRAVDADTQRRLHMLGVRRFSDIAAWTPSDVNRISQSLGFYGRIEQENWIEQAQILAKGGETFYSKALAVPAASAAVAAAAAAASAAGEALVTRPLTGLRSVRSEALRGDAGPSSEPAAPGVDDLKRIRGVGILIEKKLHQLGITSYEQVANWTVADIDRISQVLDFKGRIERENWVEQARILASGGQTDFSRRADRGEIY